MIVGAGATGCVFTEFALIDPAYYRIFRPIVSRVIEDTGNGFFLFISTPRGIKNHFTELFTKYLPDRGDSEAIKKIKDQWFLEWIDCYSSKKHNGQQMLSQEFLDQERLELGDDIFGQEYELNLNISSNGTWYGKQMKKMYDRENLCELGRWEGEDYLGFIIPGEKVYISFDLGLTDSFCLTFFQIESSTGNIRVFDFFHDSGKITEYYINYIKEYCSDHRIRDFICILPHDADYQIDRASLDNRNNTAIKRSDIFHEHGINTIVINKSELGVKKTRVITRINNTRKYFDSGKVIIDTENCFSLIEALKSYKKKYDKQTGEYLDIPVHDWASDYCDSFGYFFVFAENYLKLDNFTRETVAIKNKEVKY